MAAIAHNLTRAARCPLLVLDELLFSACHVTEQEVDRADRAVLAALFPAAAEHAPRASLGHPGTIIVRPVA